MMEGRVGVVRATKIHRVALHALKPPDVSLDVFHDVADVAAIGVTAGRW
jgi:hypothetical protein